MSDEEIRRLLAEGTELGGPRSSHRKIAPMKSGSRIFAVCLRRGLARFALCRPIRF